MSDAESLFRVEGDFFVPNEAAGNPWGELTAGGPVAGLIAHAVEQANDDPDLFVARLTVDLMRPVPRVPLTVDVRPLRTGKRLQVVQAGLHIDGKLHTNATAHLLRRSDLDGSGPDAVVPFAGPEGLEDRTLLPPELELRWGVHDLMQVRWIADQSATGTSRAWMRMPLPLLAGEPLSPLSHVAILADAISAASPVGELFGPWINTDVSLHLHREMRGEWLGVEVQREVQPTGIGTAHALLYDAEGPLGTAQEAVMVNQLG
ncbi:thioesterase family protein [Saccharopolyspora rhizosphaerae]|uniref:Thioesterase family protein n=1 Tax=Saccharopolyspora rhizosphaerae TaxID=2492662 RepID=A0A3R8PXX9_9PSEU|nr:thioesterase family protein [Saccharopolyspora rhizosphaerae]RRO12756.1 thioesterase family protein [Saccharopolyspora rhizosphaerae]